MKRSTLASLLAGFAVAVFLAAPALSQQDMK